MGNAVLELVPMTMRGVYDALSSLDSLDGSTWPKKLRWRIQEQSDSLTV
jgi:hypothetical protein